MTLSVLLILSLLVGLGEPFDTGGADVDFHR